MATSSRWKTTSFAPSLLITNGIGDWIVYDSLLTDRQLKAATTVYWANRGQDDLIPICRQIPAWSHLEHVPIWTDWSRIRGFADPTHLRNHLRSRGVNVPASLDQSDEVWPGTWRERKQWHPTRLLDQPLADLSRFELPACYVTIQPSTPHNVGYQGQPRRFVPKEWYAIHALLEQHDCVGLVVDLPDPATKIPPGLGRILDYRGRFNLAESFEVVKRGIAHVGTDSCLSVLAAQVHPSNRLLVRTRNMGLLRDWWQDYYRPHVEPPWLVWGTITPEKIVRAGFTLPMPVAATV